MKLNRLPQMLKGLRRTMGDNSRRVRRGVSPQDLKRAMDKCLDPRGCLLNILGPYTNRNIVPFLKQIQTLATLEIYLRFGRTEYKNMSGSEVGSEPM